MRRLAPFLAFVVLALAFVAPALPGFGKVLGGEDLFYFRPPLSEFKPPALAAPSDSLLADPAEVFHPDLEWMVEQVRNGTPPLWNPDVGTGSPQLATQQTAPLFPPNLLAFALPFWETLGLIAALRILLAASGMYLFCRRSLQLRPAAAAFSAVSFAAGAYFIAWLEHPHGNIYALIPWLLLAIDRAIRHGRWSDGALLGAVVGATALGGHPQSLLIASFLAIPYAFWRLLEKSPGRAPLVRVALVLASGTALGLAAGAVMLLPLAEFLGASLGQDRGGYGGIDGSALYSLVLPELWGRPDGGFSGAGPINYFERTIYVGAPALLLAIAGLVLRPNGAQRFFALMAVAGALMAVTLPVITWFVDHVPPFSLVTMVRAFVITSFAIAVLAGLGLQRLMEADAAGRRRALVAATIACVVPVAWLIALHAGSLGAFGDALGSVPLVAGEPDTAAAAEAGAVLRWLVFAVPVVLLIVALRRRPQVAAIAVAGLLAVQALDLVELGRGLHPITDDRVVETGPTPALAQAMRDQGSGRSIGSDYYLLPDSGLRFELRDARVRAQPTIGRVDRLYHAYTGQLPRTFSVDWPGSAAVLDAFGVRQVLTGARPAPPANPSLQLVAEGTDDRLYHNTTALPRAYVATSWRPSRGESESLDMTVSSTTQELQDAPVVEQSEPPASPRSTGGEARVVVDGVNRVELEVDSPAPGRLVLLDAYYPGWKATVNAEPVAIAPTNAAFRSVPVPAGRSNVAFSYEPISVYAGAAISVVAWAVLVGIAVVLLLRRRARNGGAPAGNGRTR